MTRQGDGLKLQQLAQASRAEDQKLSQHTDHCGTCSKAVRVRVPSQRCDLGWALLKSAHAALVELREHADRIDRFADDQYVLWEEACEASPAGQQLREAE